MNLTATLERELLSDGTLVYVALCRELDIASQGESQSEAVANLGEAVSLFLESADDAEIGRRFRQFLATPVVLTQSATPLTSREEVAV